MCVLQDGASVCWDTARIEVGSMLLVAVDTAIGVRTIAEPLWVGSVSESIVLKGLGDSEARSGAGQ